MSGPFYSRWMNKLAQQNPDREVVFFGIGFETTAPANAMTVHQARLGWATSRCWSRTSSCRRPSPRSWESPSCRVQAFLGAGHVCGVMGTAEYPPLAERYEVPIVVTGFEPLDILEGIRRAVIQLRRVATRWRTPTGARCLPRATPRRRRCWARSSWSPTGRGAASG